MGKLERDTQLQAILYSALSEPIGLVVWASDTHLARQRLYVARAAAADPALAVLQFRLSPWDAHELIITKSTPGPEELGL